LIITLTFGAVRENAEKARKYLHAIVASNHANVVGVETKLVLFTDHIGSGGHGQTRAQARFETHARHRASVFAHVAGLEKQTPTKISLAALVIRPPRSRIHVIESTMAHEHLSWTVTQHGAQATARFAARNLTHANVKRLAIVGVCGQTTAFFLVRQRLGRETEETHDLLWEQGLLLYRVCNCKDSEVSAKHSNAVLVPLVSR
jgi:hypothetical protein